MLTCTVHSVYVLENKYDICWMTCVHVNPNVAGSTSLVVQCYSECGFRPVAEFGSGGSCKPSSQALQSTCGNIWLRRQCLRKF